MKQRITKLIALASLLVPFGALGEEPYRLDTAFGVADWFSLSGSVRARYESLEGRYRANASGSDQVFSLRTLLLTKLTFDPMQFVFEIQDSRQELADSGSTVNGAIVNAAEVLQAYAAINTNNFLLQQIASTFRLGRFTLDIGSRRLIARTRYRNTNNGFTGLDWNLRFNRGDKLRTFLVVPVSRQPGDQSSLLDNEVEFDDELFGTKIWGVYYERPMPVAKDRLELLLIGVHENDASDVDTRNRDIYTVSGRYLRPRQPGAWDYQLETALQFGESRSNPSSANRQDLDHFAHFHHAEVGYSLPTSWSPRIALQYDYASGDDAPDDGDNGRFDTLFGARRFDFGPTSMFGPFQRSNLSSPGLRVSIKPANRVSAFAAVRGFWLASAKDAWVTARTRDPSGASGSYLGTQVDARVRFEALPENLRLEAGVAHVFDGDFMRKAPNAPREGDLTYLYVQTLIWF